MILQDLSSDIKIAANILEYEKIHINKGNNLSVFQRNVENIFWPSKIYKSKTTNYTTN